MIEIFAVVVALVVVATVVLAVDLSSMWIPALLKWRDLLHRRLMLAFGRSRFGPALRRPDEPYGSRVVATDSALEAEEKRLADLNAELRKLTAALAKQEAALAQRERILQRSLADAERSSAQATARIEAREALLATQEAELQQQESELADRRRSLAERERELIKARAALRAPRATPSKSPEDRLGAAGSDWWEKQLGHPLSTAELKAQARALGLSAAGTKAELVERIEKAQH
jgi:DNA repair exonuclease SbcCD ATPase subunit